MAAEGSPRRSEGLWADAWRRLRKNTMSMVGIVVVVVMSLTAILADVVSPYEPETQQRWLGALPPWTEVLSLRNELRTTVGERPGEMEVPAPLAEVLGDGREHRLEYEVQEEAVARIRLVASGTKIEALTLSEPGTVPTRPDVLTVAESDYLRAADGTRLDVTELRVGGNVPAGVAQAGTRYVALLDRVTRRPEDRFSLAVTVGPDGRVATIRRGDEQLESVALGPADVADVRLDGERLTQLHVLGTDQEGRDHLSRLVFGARISLLVGLAATLVSLLIGVVYGAVSGYVGGWVDGLLMRIVDILYGLPYLFLVILLMVAYGRDIFMLFIALGAVQWLTMARIVRGQVLSLREKEFVDAAITIGTPWWAILGRHLIPNTLGVVVVYMTLTIPAVILQESFLSFIGLTVEWDGRPLESWGALVNYGRESLGGKGQNWWLLVFPSIAMSVTLFSMNFLGDGLRDALDPQQRGKT